MRGCQYLCLSCEAIFFSLPGMTQRSSGQAIADMNQHGHPRGPVPASGQALPPQMGPQAGGNSAAGGTSFFVDQKKGEINELKQVRNCCRWQSGVGA